MTDATLVSPQWLHAVWPWSIHINHRSFTLHNVGYTATYMNGHMDLTCLCFVKYSNTPFSWALVVVWWCVWLVVCGSGSGGGSVVQLLENAATAQRQCNSPYSTTCYSSRVLLNHVLLKQGVTQPRVTEAGCYSITCYWSRVLLNHVLLKQGVTQSRVTQAGCCSITCYSAKVLLNQVSIILKRKWNWMDKTSKSINMDPDHRSMKTWLTSK